LAPLPFNRRLKRAFTASLWLWLIAYPKAKRAQAAAFVPCARDSDYGFANAANPVISLEKMVPHKTGAKLGSGAPYEILNHPLRKLIQNLQTLNQKVK